MFYRTYRFIAISCILLPLIGTPILANAKTQGESILQTGLNHLDKKQMKQVLGVYNQLAPYPLERKILAWAVAVYGKGVDYGSLQGFAKQLNGWPKQKRIKHNVEKSIIAYENDNLIQATFAHNPPTGFDAAFALAKHYLKTQKIEKAREAILPFWKYEKLDKSQERAVVNNLKSILQTQDFKARVELLLSEKLLNRAKSIARLAKMEVLVNTRIAVERNTQNAPALLQSAQKFYGKHPNFLLSLARYLRRKDEIKQAAQAIIAADNPHENAGDIFWQEQRIIAAKLLEQNEYKIAYKVVARNVAQSPADRIDSDFYAGWIALRYLDNPEFAEPHFARIITVAKRPLSLSRGHYWLARTYKKQGKNRKAKAQYNNAAEFDASYYGQLARIELNQRDMHIPDPNITDKQKKEFENRVLIKAISKLEITGHKSKAKVFYQHLAQHLDSIADLYMLAERVQKKGEYQMALKLGKIAHRRGKKVKNLAWPIGVIPINKNTRVTSLAYAISRQESTFQVDARSSANALGLMQLLPATAKESARKAGVAYSSSRLIRDAEYNARLGTTYLEGQINRFKGSYILAFVAYNAGPTRVKEWIKRFGDPRGGELYDVVDWIEKIPYSETRNYVQRVLENFQIYKARLAKPYLNLDVDLTKGKI